ncbi:MAG: tyrosine-type recombinase/integrase [Alsobacter sp.]
MPIRQRTHQAKDGSIRIYKQAYFTDQAGKFRAKIVKTVEEGEAWILEKRALDKNDRLDPASPVRFKTVANLWLQNRKSEKLARITLQQAERDLENYILPHWGHLRFRELCPQDAIDFFAKLSKKGVSGQPLSASTQRRIRCTLQGVLDLAKNKKLLTQDVLSSVKIKGTKPTRVTPSEAETRAIIEEALKPSTPAFARALAVLLNFTGMRGEEARALVWGKVNFEQRTIRVDQAANSWGEIIEPKTEASKRTYAGVDTLVMAVLQQLRDERNARARPETRFTGPGDFVFGTGTGRVFSHNNLIERVYGPLQVRAGVSKTTIRAGKEKVVGKFGLHAPRRSVGSLAHAHGELSIAAISKLLGHQDPSFTLRTYIGATQDGAEHGEGISRTFAALKFANSMPKANLKLVKG